MSPGLPFAYACLCALAWLVTRRDRAHLACTAYISFMTVGELARPALRLLYRGMPKPYVGWARVAFESDSGITLGWQFFFVACCLHYFTRWRPSVAIIAWLATWGFFVVAHARLSSAVIGNVYLGIWWAGLTLSWASIAWGLFRRSDLEPGLAHLMLILYAASDVGVLLLRMVAGLRERWDLARISAYLVVFTGIAVHAAWLLERRRPTRAA